MRLALFDVDFTLTKKETLIAFYAYLIKKEPTMLIYLPRALMSGALFQLGFQKEKKTKEMFLSFLKNIPEQKLEDYVSGFVKNSLSGFLYEDGIQKVKELKDKGYTIVLTSASPEFYILRLKDIFHADFVMGTRFEIQDGIFTAKMLGENNKGQEKVRRLYEVLPEDEIDWENSYMFSDSLSDDPLLCLAGKPYLINYKKKNPKYPVLNWR